ncbi:MAG: hypothetical protein IJG63_06575 [Oscillospiraceae bacterium]|nr:hypothetical protein [Oscillospiraceae bacterium]
MKKTLYSLMLNDEVVRQVDILAHRLGTSRSSLINQILADYVDYTTPERRVSDIFRTIEEIMLPQSELVPFFAPNAQTMSLKSSLEYKYRPTVKYEVDLSANSPRGIGELSVIFRTQSTALVSALTSFFRLWKDIEDRQLSPMLPNGPVSYALYDGKFVRSLSAPDRDCTAQELAGALSDYIKLFDTLMKSWLSSSLTAGQIEEQYCLKMSRAAILL